MAIVNRDVDQSMQKEEYSYVGSGQFGSTVIATGASLILSSPIPFFYVLENIRVAAFGCSGGIAMRPLIGRFVAGATQIVCGTTIAAQNFGTSGVLGASFLSGGSTLLLGLPGDYIGMDFVGANTAIAQIAVDVVVKKTSDISTYWGL